MLVSCGFARKIFGCPGPGIIEGNLSDLPASNEADESEQSLLWFMVSMMGEGGTFKISKNGIKPPLLDIIRLR